MHLMFDLDQLMPNWESLLSEEEVNCADNIYEFVEARIKVLREQMDAEDLIDSTKGTVIAITQGRVMFNYSEGLTEKLKSCFADNDTAFLSKMILECFRKF